MRYDTTLKDLSPDREKPPAHEVIPLVTVAKDDAFWAVLEGGCWGRYAIEYGKAFEIEQECARHGFNMPISRYYYAGLAHKEFGNFAFAYGSEHEQGQEWLANPFDTGGVLLGGMHPFIHQESTDELIEESRRRDSCAFIAATSVENAEWRSAFKTFLDQCYGGQVQPYLQNIPPDRTSAWGDPPPPLPNLPYKFFQNEDRRAWTWEIRLADRPPLERGLLFWSCRRGVWDDTVQRLTDIQGKEPRFPRSRGVPPLPPPLAPSGLQSPCNALQERIIAWMSENSA
ncbi:MAG: hypothetical protein HQL63_14565 [Magnetococcales bacterium]|nr:hypothetical protein [Magnetococcales bacterium]